MEQLILCTSTTEAHVLRACVQQWKATAMRSLPTYLTKRVVHATRESLRSAKTGATNKKLTKIQKCRTHWWLPGLKGVGTGGMWVGL